MNFFKKTTEKHNNHLARFYLEKRCICGES